MITTVFTTRCWKSVRSELAAWLLALGALLGMAAPAGAQGQHAEVTQLRVERAEEGILVTVAPFPMVKRGDESHRLSFTAANTDEDVERLIAAFAKVREVMG